MVLDKIKLLEIAAAPPVEWASCMLGDFGAEVIRIERIPKSKLRMTSSGISNNLTPKEEARRAAYDALNRNKQSIALNLKSIEGQRIFYELVSKSDVVLEGFRPGVMERLKCDYATLKKINPCIIYCSVTGYGQSSDFQELVGHDLNYISMGGVLDLTGRKSGPPIMPGTQVADWGGASLAVIGILLALIARDKSNMGQHVDISLADSVIGWQMFLASEYFESGSVPKRGERVNTGGAPYNNIYETKDEKYITIACWEPKFYKNLCRILGREDFIPDQDARSGKREEIFEYFRNVFLTKTRDEWFEFLRKEDICIAPVYSFDEVFSSEYVRKRESVVTLNHPLFGKVRQVGNPVRLSATPARWNNFAPAYGQDTDRILQKLDYDEEKIRSLRKAGYIF